MDALQEQHRAYVEALRAHADAVIARIRERSQKSFQAYYSQQALETYESIMESLKGIPEKIAGEIQDAYKALDKNEPDELRFLKRRLTRVKQLSLYPSIRIIIEQKILIEKAGRNGANVSEMLHAVDEYAEKIKVESEKLFPTE